MRLNELIKPTASPRRFLLDLQAAYLDAFPKHETELGEVDDHPALFVWAGDMPKTTLVRFFDESWFSQKPALKIRFEANKQLYREFYFTDSATLANCVGVLHEALIDTLAALSYSEVTDGAAFTAVLRRYIETGEASAHDLSEVLFNSEAEIEAYAEKHGLTVCAETPGSNSGLTMHKGKTAVLFIKEK